MTPATIRAVWGGKFTRKLIRDRCCDFAAGGVQNKRSRPMSGLVFVARSGEAIDTAVGACGNHQPREHLDTANRSR